MIKVYRKTDAIKARSKDRVAYYHNRVANTKATIRVIKDIRANMLSRNGDKI